MYFRHIFMYMIKINVFSYLGYVSRSKLIEFYGMWTHLIIFHRKYLK